MNKYDYMFSDSISCVAYFFMMIINLAIYSLVFLEIIKFIK